MKSTTVNNYIKNMDAVKNLSLITSKFPSFELDETCLKETLKDVVTEKLRIAMDSNKYGTLSGLKIGYDEFAHAQNMETAGIKMSEKQQKLLSFMNEVLPNKMAKDPNMSTTELMRTTLSNAMSSRINDSVMDIQFLSALHENSPHPATSFEAKDKSEKLASTLMMIKESFPVIYAHIESSMDDMLFEDTFKNIKLLMNNPSDKMKSEIYECDPNVAKRMFPLEMDNLKRRVPQNSI